MPDPSDICNLYHSSQKCQILNPLGKARDRTLNLTVPSQVHFRCATTGTPPCYFLGRKRSQDSDKAAALPPFLPAPGASSPLSSLRLVLFCAHDLGLRQSSRSSMQCPQPPACCSGNSLFFTLCYCIVFLFVFPPQPEFSNFFLISIFRATLTAYGSSQARGSIGAATAGLRHSNSGSEPHLRPTPQLRATPDP